MIELRDDAGRIIATGSGPGPVRLAVSALDLLPDRPAGPPCGTMVILEYRRRAWTTGPRWRGWCTQWTANIPSARVASGAGEPFGADGGVPAVLGEAPSHFVDRRANGEQVPGDELVEVVGAHGVPVDAIGGNGDLG
jgi:hypothetical protein